MSRAPASRGNGWGNGALAALCRPSSPTSASFAVDAARGSAKTSRPAPANPASSWTFGERQALLAYVESPTHPIAVTYMSACMEAKTGRRTSELAEPDRYWDLVHPQDVAMVRAEHDEAATGRRLLSLEYRLLAQDGTVAYVRDEARSVPTGDPERFALEGYCLDITAHRRIEEDLRAGEERFRTLVANIPGVVYRCGCDWLWTMQFMSDSIQELSGYPATDFLANRVRTYGSIIHPEDRSYVFEAIDEALADGSPYEMHSASCTPTAARAGSPSRAPQSSGPTVSDSGSTASSSTSPSAGWPRERVIGPRRSSSARRRSIGIWRCTIR